MEQGKNVAPDSVEAMTDNEKWALRRAQLYAAHKARGSLGTYYYLYPDDAPPGYWKKERQDDGRER
jgi:hypothetical protein